MEIEGVWCGDPSCGFTVPTEEVAEAAGWVKVGDALHCALHWPLARHKARREAQIEASVARQREKHAETAKRALSAAGYRLWDEFQADLADYRRKTGKPAPRRLRVLAPREFLAHHAANGRIDVEAVVSELEAAENRAAGTRKWVVERGKE